jgi:hypothetical protein
MVKFLLSFVVSLCVCWTESHCSNLTEYPGQRSISDDSFTSNGTNLGECWGALVHSVIETKKTRKTAALTKEVDRFISLQSTLCRDKGRDSMEWHEFTDKSSVIISDLSDIQTSVPDDAGFCTEIGTEMTKLSSLPVVD